MQTDLEERVYTSRGDHLGPGRAVARALAIVILALSVLGVIFFKLIFG